MKALLALCLATASPLALAAQGFNIEKAIWTFVALIGLAVIFGLLYMMVETAPWIRETWKAGLKWLLYVVAALLLIFLILSWIRPYLPS